MRTSHLKTSASVALLIVILANNCILGSTINQWSRRIVSKLPTKGATSSNDQKSTATFEHEKTEKPNTHGRTELDDNIPHGLESPGKIIVILIN